MLMATLRFPGQSDHRRFLDIVERINDADLTQTSIKIIDTADYRVLTGQEDGPVYVDVTCESPAKLQMLQEYMRFLNSAEKKLKKLFKEPSFIPPHEQKELADQGQEALDSLPPETRRHIEETLKALGLKALYNGKLL